MSIRYGRFFGLPVVIGILLTPLSDAQTNLGLVGVKTIYGRYLQAYPDGEMHASNPHRNEEETWFLIEVDNARHIYALQNWRNGKFLSKRLNGCAAAISSSLSSQEQWVLVGGRAFGVINGVAFKSVFDGSFLAANAPAEDTVCGGEVTAQSTADLQASGSWPGWWVLEPASAPTAGRDFWNTVGGAINGIVNIGPAAIETGTIGLIAGKTGGTGVTPPALPLMLRDIGRFSMQLIAIVWVMPGLARPIQPAISYMVGS